MPQKLFGVEIKQYPYRLYGNLVPLLLFADQIILSPFHNSQLQVTQETWIMQISSYFTKRLFLLRFERLSSLQCGTRIPLICTVIAINQASVCHYLLPTIKSFNNI